MRPGVHFACCLTLHGAAVLRAYLRKAQSRLFPPWQTDCVLTADRDRQRTAVHRVAHVEHPVLPLYVLRAPAAHSECNREACEVQRATRNVQHTTGRTMATHAALEPRCSCTPCSGHMPSTRSTKTHPV